MLIEVRILIAPNIGETIQRAGAAIREAKAKMRGRACVFGPRITLDKDGRPSLLRYRISNSLGQGSDYSVWDKPAKTVQDGAESNAGGRNGRD